MNKLNLSKRERRTVIILMLVNVFALFVNYFNIGPRKQFTGHIYYSYAYLFTDVGANEMPSDDGYGLGLRKKNSWYETRSPKHFWPFTKFYDEGKGGNWVLRGLFPDYDHTEFFAYTALIFGVIFIKKIW